MQNTLSKSIEDYIEALYVVELSKKPIKSVEISAMLDVSKPAVTKAMNELLKLKYIEKKPYSDIKLTELGRKVGKEVYKRHKIIKQFLLNLGVKEEIAENDCCLIEHCISKETLKAIELFLKNKLETYKSKTSKCYSHNNNAN